MTTRSPVKKGNTGSDRLDIMFRSPSVHESFATEEINSLRELKEIMGISCVDTKGNVKKTITLKAVADDNSAHSVDPINKIGNKCNDDMPVWWHTHASTLSSMSSEDRLSAGNLKMVLDNNVTCAIGIEGYTCHDVSLSPPAVMTKKWDGTFLKKLEDSAILDEIIDLTDDWKFDVKKESDIHQINCISNKENIFICTGIDWNTGFRSFPIGAFNKVVLKGDVLAMPEWEGFRLQASSIDEKLDCVTITPGSDGFRLLYCK